MLTNIEELQARRKVAADQLALAQGLPDTYLDAKNTAITQYQTTIDRIDRRIAALQAEQAAADAKLKDPDYNALKQYGENLDVAVLKEIQAIVDDNNLTHEQKCFLVGCKGGTY